MSELRGLGTATLVGPDWSHWPTRVLGSASPTTIAHWAGTHRIISPEQTWLAVQPLLELAGITRVADLTWLDDLGIPTVQAVRPASLTLSVSQGKAATYRAAQVSAVMESLESWHCENVTPDLLGAAPIDLKSALTYNPARLRCAPNSLYHPRAKLDWMIATTLLTGRQTWVPWKVVGVNLAVTDCWDPPTILMEHNGLASGNSYHEAALHGLYEIMERHSMAIAEAGSTLFDVPLDDVSGSDSGPLIEMIHRAGSRLQIARIDTWDGFYCFLAELRSPMAELPFSGSGLHHDPNVALSRAITEAAQSRLTDIICAREDLPPAIYDRLARVHSYAPLQRTTRKLPKAQPIAWDVPAAHSLNGLVVAAATAIATQAGTEPLAVVCDFADACVPVVKVIAPGLVSAATSPARTPLDQSA
jgi:ribosomal protein S12 methylthiotransferase accessory factor